MSLKFLLLLLVLGWIVYKANRVWKRFKTFVKAVQSIPHPPNQPKTIKKDNLTIIYPSQSYKKTNAQSGEYIDFEEEENTEK